MNRDEFIKTVPTLEKMYVIYSGLTHAPYTVCNPETFIDEVFAFPEEKEAVAYVEKLREQKIPCTAMMFQKELMLRFFSEMFVFGIDGIVFYSGEDEFHYEITEIAKRPDFSQMEPKARPVENPQLQISMIYYMQEARKQEKTITPEEMKALDEEMMVNLTRARYYLPFRLVEQDGKQLTQFVLMKLQNESSWIPVFTDVYELNRFRGKQELQVAVVPFAGLAEMVLPEGVKGFMINPSGVGVGVPHELMKRMAPQKVGTQAAPTPVPVAPAPTGPVITIPPVEGTQNET